ncbi:hypothetical protein Lal_00005123 [Lupinus albus]|nr:hypothetical protein Lal_00005123 [Lupinus albus]
MLSPKRTKFRKAHKGRIHGNAKGGTALNFGSFGLKALEPERITARQIEAARRAITRAMKRQGRVWIRIFPDLPVSTKPAEVRMGSGKGSPEYWAARVKPGRILCGKNRLRSGGREAADQGEAGDPPGRCRGDRGMKAVDIRTKSADELNDQLLQLKKEQFNLRFQKASGQLENTARVNTVRRDIARIKTILGERARSADAGK